MIDAVRMLQALGYTYRGSEWLLTGGAASAATTPLSLLAKADAMHGALMRRADELAGCTVGSNGETELEAIINLIEAYEAERWPLGKEGLAR